MKKMNKHYKKNRKLKLIRLKQIKMIRMKNRMDYLVTNRNKNRK